jgi:predicted ester cyclase
MAGFEWVQEFLDAVLAGEGDKCAASFAEDGYLDDVGLSYRADGRDAIAQFLSLMSASGPDARFEIENVVSDGEHFAVQWRLTGTQQSTSKNSSRRGASLGQLRDGLLVSWSDYWNPNISPTE